MLFSELPAPLASALAARGYEQPTSVQAAVIEPFGQAELAEFINGLDIGEDARTRLLALTPASYLGIATAQLEYLN